VPLRRVVHSTESSLTGTIAAVPIGNYTVTKEEIVAVTKTRQPEGGQPSLKKETSFVNERRINTEKLISYNEKDDDRLPYSKAKMGTKEWNNFLTPEDPMSVNLEQKLSKLVTHSLSILEFCKFSLVC
jgi:hypothetical protein